jgi:hypothetical protein
VYNSSTHGLGNSAAEGAAAGHIVVDRTQDFLILTSRYDVSSENSTNPTGAGPSITFPVDHSNGNLTLMQQYPLGGSVAANLAISQSATLVVLGYQDTNNATFIHRDPDSGMLTVVAYTAELDGILAELRSMTTWSFKEIWALEMKKRRLYYEEKAFSIYMFACTWRQKLVSSTLAREAGKPFNGTISYPTPFHE